MANSKYAGRIVTRARYNATVKQYGQARADAGIKKYGLKLEAAAPKVATYTKKPTVNYNNPNAVILPQKKPQIGRVGRRDGNYTASQIAQNNASIKRDAYNARISRQNAERAAAQRRAAIELARKNKFKAYEKKGGGSANILKLAENKWGTNSIEYRKIKNEVNRYTPVKNTVREIIKPTTPTKIDTKKDITSSQYNDLIKKYGDTNGVINAIKAKGATVAQLSSVKNILNKYSGEKTTPTKVITNTSTITDVNKKAPIQIDGNITEKTVFAKNWKQRIPVAEKFGIKNYTGTAKQNTILRNKLKQAKTDITPTTATPTTKDTITPTTKDTITPTTTTPIPSNTNDANKKQLNKLRLSGKTDANLLKQTSDKYGVDSNEYKTLKDFIDKNPQKDGTEGVNKDILNKTPKDIAKTKIDSLAATRDSKISKTAENFIKSSELIAGNNTKLQEFYTNMATELKTFIEDNKIREEKALERTKNTELNRVVGQIRATLARRGINIGNIPPEQLIAMSGELGANAMAKINEATSQMEQSISDLTRQKTDEINKYLEQGLIKQSEADKSIEQMRQLKEKMISDIKDSYIANTFKIAETNITNTKAEKGQALNTISTFINQLGVSGSAQKVMNNYLDAANSTDALHSMITDLNNPDSELYKAVKTAEERVTLAAQFQAKIDLMKATKSSSGSGKVKLTDKQANLMGTLNLGGRVTEKFFKDNYVEILQKLRNRTPNSNIILSNGIVINSSNANSGVNSLDKVFSGVVGQ